MLIPVTGGQLIRRGKHGYLTYRIALPSRRQKWVSLGTSDLTQAKVQAAQIWLKHMSETFHFGFEILHGGLKFTELEDKDTAAAIELMKAHAEVYGSPAPMDPPTDLPPPTILTCAETVSEAYAAFKREKIQVGAWKPATVVASDAALTTFQEIVGAPRMADCNDALFRRFREVLMVLPPHRKTSPVWRGKSLQEIVELAPGGQSIKNVNKTINFVAAFFDQYVRTHRDVLERHCLKDLLIKEKKSKMDYEERVHFTDGQVALFYAESHRDKEKTPFRFWAVMLGAYTGARVGELAQLKLEDVVEMEGITCLSLREEKGQSLKTQASRRLIPVHAKLIEAGFLSYIKEVRKEHKSEWFWREMDDILDKPDTASKWGQRVIERIKSQLPEGACFHSLRHTCATKLSHALAKAGLPATYEMDIMGHSRKGSEGQIRYDKTLLTEKVRAINLIDYDTTWTPWPGLKKLTPDIEKLLQTRLKRRLKREPNAKTS